MKTNNILKKSHFLFFIISVLGAFADVRNLYAESCPSINLENTVLKGIPTFAQFGGTCYGYSATVALEAYRRGLLDDGVSPEKLGGGKETYISPFMTVVRAGAKKDRKQLNGGSSCMVANTSEKIGLCTSEHLPETWQNKKGEWVQLSGYVRRLLEAYRGLSDGTMTIDQAVMKAFMATRKSSMDPDRAPSKSEIQSALLAETEVRFLEQLVVDPACKGEKFYLPSGKCDRDGVVLMTLTGFKNRVISQLTKKHQPMGISYCAAVLRKGKEFKGVTRKMFDLDVKKKCGRHASLLVASRKRNNQCEFLVRNSWGPSVKTYSKDWESEGGNVWISAKALYNNVFGTYSIEE